MTDPAEVRAKPTYFYHQGRFQCAAEGCRHLITHYAGQDPRPGYEPVWCVDHASMARAKR